MLNAQRRRSRRFHMGEKDPDPLPSRILLIAACGKPVKGGVLFFFLFLLASLPHRDPPMAWTNVITWEVMLRVSLSAASADGVQHWQV